MSSRIVVLFMMLFLGCGLLSADTITVTGVDNTRGVTSLLWIDEHGTPTNVYYAGVINLLLNQTFQRDSLCAQLFVDIGLSTYNTTVMTPYAAEAEFGRNLEQAAWLVHKELPLVTTADEGAGLQLAIWDIVEDGGDGLTQGNVKASTDPSNPTDPTIPAWRKRMKRNPWARAPTWPSYTSTPPLAASRPRCSSDPSSGVGRYRLRSRPRWGSGDWDWWRPVCCYGRSSATDRGKRTPLRSPRFCV